MSTSPLPLLKEALLLIGTAPTPPNDSASPVGQDGFQALLNIGAGLAEKDEYGFDQKDVLPETKAEDREPHDPVAVPLDVPTEIFTANRTEPEEDVRTPAVIKTLEPSGGDAKQPEAYEAPSAKPTAPSTGQAQPADAASHAIEETGAVKAPAASVVSASVGPVGLPEQLHKRIATLSHVLTRVIEILKATRASDVAVSNITSLSLKLTAASTAAATIEVPSANSGIASASGPAIASLATDSNPAVPFLQPVINSPVPGDASVKIPGELIEHAQTALLKILHVLKGEPASSPALLTTGAEPSPVDMERLSPLLKHLTSDLAELERWLATQPADGVVTDGQTKYRLSDIRQLIKSGLDLIASLTSRSAPEAIADMPAALPVMDKAFKADAIMEALKPVPVAAHAFEKTADNLSSEIMKNPAAATTVEPAQPKPATGNTPSVQPSGASAVAAAVQPGFTDANTSGGYSGRQDSLPQPVLPTLGSGSSGASSTVASASFARLLGQPAVHQPVAEQAIFHIKTMLKDGSSSIRIQLDPAELGKLDIRLHVTADGKTGVVITADNKTTLDALQRDARGLEQALADIGLKTDSGSLSFNLRGEQQEQAHERSQAALTYRKAAPEEETVSPVAVLTGSYVLDLAEGLDIRI